MRGTPHNPIRDIWSDVQTRVGTPHKILRCLRSRGGRGTPHIPNEVMWSDVQTRVGTPHKALEQLGWGHRTKYLFKKIHMVGGWLGGWLGGRFFQDIIPLRGSILQAGTCQILSLAEYPSLVWQSILAGGDTAHQNEKKSIWSGGWVDGWKDGVFLQEILPLRGSILQAGTC